METFSRETKPLHPWYVTGLLDGLGTFTFSRSGRQIAVYLGVKLAASDEALLMSLQSFFGGAGRIYAVPSRDAVYYRVSRRLELGHIVTHLDRYPLRGPRARVYSVWREMAVQKEQRFRAPDRDNLEKLASELSARAPRNRSRERKLQ